MKNYSYEITDDGYYILINGKRVIHQYGIYIPDSTKSFEENAIAQIEELKESDKRSVNSINDSERITNLELAFAEMYEGGL